MDADRGRQLALREDPTGESQIGGTGRGSAGAGLPSWVADRAEHDPEVLVRINEAEAMRNPWDLDRRRRGGSAWAGGAVEVTVDRERGKWRTRVAPGPKTASTASVFPASKLMGRANARATRATHAAAPAVAPKSWSAVAAATGMTTSSM